MVRTSTIDLSAELHLCASRRPQPKTPASICLVELYTQLGAFWQQSRNAQTAFAESSRCPRDLSRPCPAKVPSLVVLLYLTGDKSKVVSVRWVWTEKSPLNTVNDGVLRLQWRPMARPNCARARNSMRKCSLSTPRHTRKYELLTVRIPVMPRSGIRQVVQGPLRDHRQEGA